MSGDRPVVLTTRRLNRALLARQLLLERATLTIPKAVGRIGGLQTQYAPSGYVGLWTRLARFGRDELTRALEEGSVVQGTLMRSTIHIVPRSEYWLYVMGVRRARREWWIRTVRPGVSEVELLRGADELRAALADGPRYAAELGDLASGFLGHVGLWVDLLRVPPSGTWERRRADRLALAEEVVGPCDVTEEDGLAHLVRAYLRAFGPAPFRDIASWAGVGITALRGAGAALALVRYRGEDGRELVDLEGEPLADPEAPAPVRFLPHWDANLLVHARRAAILPEAHRPRVFTTKNPFSVGTYLVDGAVAGAWSMKDGRIRLEAYEDVAPTVWREVEQEAERLESFHA